MYLAYTYFIKNTITNQYYYGFRCRNIKLKRTPEEDFWIYYFTSSKEIKKLLKEYGKDSFDIKIIMRDLNWKKCHEYEQELISEHLDKELCLNSYCARSEKFSTAGTVHSQETKDKISFAGRGKTRTNETKNKISAAKTGVPRPEETKVKMNKFLKGHLTWNKGVPHSAETKAKISAARKGKPGNNLGKVCSEETKAKISATLKARSKILQDKT
jgi:hypothetical protein